MLRARAIISCVATQSCCDSVMYMDPAADELAEYALNASITAPTKRFSANMLPKMMANTKYMAAHRL